MQFAQLIALDETAAVLVHPLKARVRTSEFGLADATISVFITSHDEDLGKATTVTTTVGSHFCGVGRDCNWIGFLAIGVPGFIRRFHRLSPRHPCRGCV